MIMKTDLFWKFKMKKIMVKSKTVFNLELTTFEENFYYKLPESCLNKILSLFLSKSVILKHDCASNYGDGKFFYMWLNLYTFHLQIIICFTLSLFVLSIILTNWIYDKNYSHPCKKIEFLKNPKPYTFDSANTNLMKSKSE